MPEVSAETEVDARPPLLNWLIVVTLVTIVASCLYLGNYYLGETPSSKPVWYSLPLFCSPLAESCSTRTSAGASIGMRLESSEKGTLLATPRISGMAPSRIMFRVINLDDRGTQRRDVVATRSAAPVQLNICTESCSSSRNNWRIELVVTTPSRMQGTWSDVSLPCVQAQLAQPN
ncbi:hypothetical protein R84981_002447 [Carnimonas sp. R-84981]|uniref:hypothetical protein n=1 Tax=Carnimonas bestiolae TaxID=3402172 RepID=UPI003EDC8E7D